MKAFHPPIAGIILVSLAGIGPAAAGTAEVKAVLAETDLVAAREALAAREFAGAIKLFRQAAEKGSLDAQFYLGLLYQEGKGVTQDYEAAAVWYLKAATGGQTEAQYNLGNLYQNGLGVPQDSARALTWFRKAAQRSLVPADAAPARSVGSSPAAKTAAPATAPAEQAGPTAAQQQQLENAKKSPEKLAAELSKRASQGDPEAQWKLGEMYENGKGVRQDPVIAQQWKTMATAAGYKP